MIRSSINSFSLDSITFDELLSQRDFLSILTRKDNDNPDIHKKVNDYVSKFAFLDSDGDGILTAKDLAKNNFLSPLFASRIVETAKTPCDFGWFVIFYNYWSSFSSDEVKSILFSAIDIEGDGTISRENLEEFYSDVSIVAKPIFDKIFLDITPRRNYPSFDQLTIRVLDAANITVFPILLDHLSIKFVLQALSDVIDARSLILTELSEDIFVEPAE